MAAIHEVVEEAFLRPLESAPFRSGEFADNRSARMSEKALRLISVR
jgi:hypothetical protein